MNLPELWQHQKTAIQRSAFLRWFALFFEMGTGKTRTCIEILRLLFNSSGRIRRTIIFCPPLVIPNWVDEWCKFTKIDPKRVIPLYGSGKKRVETFKKLVMTGEPFIFVTNYESMQMEELYEAFQHWKPEVLVFDESHKLKSMKSQRSKLADALANPYDSKTKKPLPKPNVYILTGSPILNSPMDVFMQFKIMDGGKTFGWNYFAFRARYFRDRNAGMPKERYFPDWQIMTKEKDNFDALAEINRLIFENGMRVTKEECLDLPPEIIVKIECEMGKEQKRLYEEMRKEFVTYINNKAVVATLAITKARRLMQITSGFAAAESEEGEEREVVELKDVPKYEKLKELLEEILEQDQKVLIWAVHRHNYVMIKRAWEEVCKKLKVDYGLTEAYGGLNSTVVRDSVKKFQQDPDQRGFLGHPGSAGVGLNLTQGKYSIWYSWDFSLEHYLQGRARNHRGGAKEQGHDNITHYFLGCAGTIDFASLKRLENKEDIGEKVLKEIVGEL